MIVVLTHADATVVEADDCRRLHVTTSLSRAAVEVAIRTSGLGTAVENDHVLLDIDTLRQRAKATSSRPSWDEQWTRMIDYARARQWVSADGRRVLAHVEYESGAVTPPGLS